MFAGLLHSKLAIFLISEQKKQNIDTIRQLLNANTNYENTSFHQVAENEYQVRRNFIKPHTFDELSKSMKDK